MKYTYEIKFGAASYVDLTPNTEIMMEGFWEQGTMIWREKISELKIADSLYDTLESWFEDDTKFETQILVKILKDEVEDSIHWFGIKWGVLNKELHTYVVQPNVYDYWGQYFEAHKDFEQLMTGLGDGYNYHDSTWPYVFTKINNSPVLFHNVVTKAFAGGTAWSSGDIVSSLLNDDDDESGTPMSAYRGMKSDYVTGKQSYLADCGLLTTQKHTVKEVIEWLKIFRVYFWFDDNDKLRYEHISYLNDKLTDNAVDFSAYIEEYNEIWSYDNTGIPVSEKISMGGAADIGDDFVVQSIQYSNVRNRPDAMVVDNAFSLISDIGSYSSEVITDDLVLFSALENHVYELRNDDMDSFSADFNSFDIEWSVGQTCGSQDIDVTLADEFTVQVTPSSYTGLIRVFLEDRSTSTPISNVIDIPRPGGGGGTLTASASATDGRLIIEGHTDATGAAIGWVTLTHSNYVMVPNIEGVISSDVITNGPFGIGNIFNAYWQDDRISRSGEFNDITYDFNNTQYNLRRETIKIHYSAVINPLYGFNDGDRVGRIESWKRSLDTDYYEIDVIYQEDE